MTFSDDNLDDKYIDDKHEITEQKNVLQSVARAFAILELLKEHAGGLLPKQVARTATQPNHLLSSAQHIGCAGICTA